MIIAVERGLASDEVGQWLSSVAQQGYALRRFDAVAQASQLLTSLPGPASWRSVGRYYDVFRSIRDGRLDDAAGRLDGLAGQVPAAFRGRVLNSLAGVLFDAGDCQAALPVYVRAAQVSSGRDWASVLTAQRMIAVIKSVAGDQRGALEQLESLFPLARLIGSDQPHEFYNFLNSYAYELGEAGRLVEAANVCTIVLASTLIDAYPEYRETAGEIAIRGYRTPASFISLTGITLPSNNILMMPVGTAPSMPTSANRPSAGAASVPTSIQAWIENKMTDKAGARVDADEADETAPDIVMKIMELLSGRGYSKAELLEVLDFIRKKQPRIKVDGTVD